EVLDGRRCGIGVRARPVSESGKITSGGARPPGRRHSVASVVVSLPRWAVQWRAREASGRNLWRTGVAESEVPLPPTQGAPLRATASRHRNSKSRLAARSAVIWAGAPTGGEPPTRRRRVRASPRGPEPGRGASGLGGPPPPGAPGAGEWGGPPESM